MLSTIDQFNSESLCLIATAVVLISLSISPIAKLLGDKLEDEENAELHRQGRYAGLRLEEK